MCQKPCNPLWWERDDLCYHEGRLEFAGKDVCGLADAMGTPLFLYSTERVAANIKRVEKALEAAGINHRLFYAMKANRSPSLLTFLKTTGLCGIDACSPEELALARSCGFEENEISYTATSVSNRDLDILARNRGVIINCDATSAIRRLGERSPGREIGIRINPAMGTGYGSNELLRYSGSRTTKFGIYREQFDEALEMAQKYDLSIKRIHFHTGCGYLMEQLPAWRRILGECLDFIDRVEGVEAVNLGGGLGVSHSEKDSALDLSRWAQTIQEVFSGRDLTIEVEPGDYIVKDSGLLILEVNTLERKQTTDFAGVNGGFNLAMEPAFYGLLFEPVACRFKGNKEDVFKKEAMKKVTIAGNINEALDIWAENQLLPPLREGDYLALINAGAYSASMSSNHCMRGDFKELLLFS